MVHSGEVVCTMVHSGEVVCTMVHSGEVVCTMVRSGEVVCDMVHSGEASCRLLKFHICQPILVVIFAVLVSFCVLQHFVRPKEYPCTCKGVFLTIVLT